MSGRRRPGPRHPCPGACGFNIPRGLFACKSCWARLPLAIRDKTTFGYAGGSSTATEHRRAMAEGNRWYADNPIGGAR